MQMFLFLNQICSKGSPDCFSTFCNQGKCSNGAVLQPYNVLFCLNQYKVAVLCEQYQVNA